MKHTPVGIKPRCQATPQGSNPKNFMRGDCLKIHAAKPGTVNLVVTDPPYNIGVDYGNGKDADRREHQVYIAWCEEWLERCNELLAPNGSIWVIINDENAAEFAVALKRMGLTMRNWIKWYEAFGANCSKKFSRTSRHVLYFVKNEKDFTFNADAIRVPSDRQLKYNDARASSKGKVPDDVWRYHRVCGTHSERIEGVPTQLPELLCERIILTASNEGDLVYDPFVGSGTTLAVAARHGRRVAGTETNRGYCLIADKRIDRERKEWRRRTHATQNHTEGGRISIDR